ncbi:MAG: hypothetical protein CVT49_07090 [candidate division Zixibacteria bacterium HGW-Zixibacteria-1]|nr:MAG: hypothetical protein CVT49_07090 [candidate division Zixibacteria bacterium HGW-Zixibacteria-1]
MHFENEKKSGFSAKAIIVAIAVLIILIIFLQNTGVVTFRLFFWSFSMSQILLLPLIFLVGFVAGFITNLVLSRKKSE